MFDDMMMLIFHVIKCRNTEFSPQKSTYRDLHEENPIHEFICVDIGITREKMIILKMNKIGCDIDGIREKENKDNQNNP
jgi:hypothetical protein